MFKKTRLVALTSLGMLLGVYALQAQDANDSREGKGQERSVSSSATLAPATAEAPVIDMKKLSEAFGNFIGRNLQTPGLSFDLENIIKGIREGAAGQSSPLSEKEYEEMMAAVQERAFKEMSAANLKTANDFMAKNKQEKGVTEIVPGKLQYLTLKEGSGPVVEPHSSPKIHYTGKYQDGTVFGTSEEMGGPITIPLDQTIPGFSKGIIGMKEGEKRRLFVHPDLGYGTTGQLPPNELLIFDIELVKAQSDEAKDKDDQIGYDDEDSHDGEGEGENEDEEGFFEEEDVEGDHNYAPSYSKKGTY